MKNIWMLTIVITLYGLGTSSCKKADDLPNSSASQLKTQMQQGTWRISKFIDSDKDETAHFATYTFTFENSGTLKATNGSQTYSGSWSIGSSKSNDDNPSDLDFNISFNIGNDFDDLTDDWDIISQSASTVELIDVSGGNGGTDYLTFEK